MLRQCIYRALLLSVLALVCTPALAQSNDSLVVFFLSDPGVRPAGIFADGFESGNTARFDADGDNRPDIIMTREDQQGNLDALLVINAASLDTLWRVQDIGTTLGLAERDGMKLYGFTDPYGTGTPLGFLVTDSDAFAVSLTDNTVVWSWQENNYLPTLPNEIRFLGAADLTDNGRKELVVVLPETRQVMVLGKRD